VFGWLFVIHTYLYYFSLSLSLCRVCVFVREDYEDGLHREFEIITQSVRVWHVSEYSRNRINPESHGQFHAGDAYVVCWRYAINQSKKPIGRTSAVFDMNSAAAGSVCGLWRYTSVICLCVWPAHLRLTSLFLQRLPRSASGSPLHCWQPSMFLRCGTACHRRLRRHHLWRPFALDSRRSCLLNHILTFG